MSREIRKELKGLSDKQTDQSIKLAFGAAKNFKWKRWYYKRPVKIYQNQVFASIHFETFFLQIH